MEHVVESPTLMLLKITADYAKVRLKIMKELNWEIELSNSYNFSWHNWCCLNMIKKLHSQKVYYIQRGFSDLHDTIICLAVTTAYFQHLTMKEFALQRETQSLWCTASICIIAYNISAWQMNVQFDLTFGITAFQSVSTWFKNTANGWQKHEK